MNPKYNKNKGSGSFWLIIVVVFLGGFLIAKGILPPEAAFACLLLISFATIVHNRQNASEFYKQTEERRQRRALQKDQHSGRYL